MKHSENVGLAAKNIAHLIPELDFTMRHNELSEDFKRQVENI